MGIIMGYGDKINPVILQFAIEAYLNAGLFQLAKEFADLSKSKGLKIPQETLVSLEQVLSGKAKWPVYRNFDCKLMSDGSTAMLPRKPRRAKNVKGKVEDYKHTGKGS